MPVTLGAPSRNLRSGLLILPFGELHPRTHMYHAPMCCAYLPNIHGKPSEVYPKPGHACHLWHWPHNRRAETHYMGVRTCSSRTPSLPSGVFPAKQYTLMLSSRALIQKQGARKDALLVLEARHSARARAGLFRGGVLRERPQRPDVRKLGGQQNKRHGGSAPQRGRVRHRPSVPSSIRASACRRCQ